MAIARVALQVGLGVLLIAPLGAQPAGEAIDFWTGMGRFRRTIDDKGIKDPPDLSGTYDANGSAPGDTTDTYETTLTVKRWKTVETPQGAEVTIYKIRYDFDEPIEGIAVHIGHRLYFAYGSENIGLHVGAPLVLTPGEAIADRQARGVKSSADRQNLKTLGDNTFSSAKGSPWFSAVSRRGHGDFFHWDEGSRGDGSGYYSFFIRPTYWGEEFYYGLTSWDAGSHRVKGYDLESGNRADECSNCIYSGELRVTSNAGTVVQLSRVIYGRGDTAGVKGTGHVLEDGTVVWVIGGGKSAGAGYYEFVDTKLSGPYWSWGGTRLGKETLTPDAKTRAKNPVLFAPK